jgi:hypothetical protein
MPSGVELLAKSQIRSLRGGGGGWEGGWIAICRLKEDVKVRAGQRAVLIGCELDSRRKHQSLFSQCSELLPIFHSAVFC